MYKKFKSVLALLTLCCGLPLLATQFEAVNEEGNKVCFEMDLQDSLQSFFDKIEACREASGSQNLLVKSDLEDSCGAMRVELVAKRNNCRMGNVASGPVRDYNHEVTAKEKKDLKFIIKTLSEASLASLWTQQKSLEKAGDRIDHLHPLRFLMTVFTDEELKVGLQNIRSRSWVWDEFFEGLSDSLATEKRKCNLTIPQIDHFASVLGLDPNLLYPSLNANRWCEFIDLLIKLLPRKNNPSHYDM